MKKVLFLALILFPMIVQARGGWADPPDGWLYVYEANEDEDAFMPNFWEVGCLDGGWMRSSNSDQWDGSAPGEDGTSPGGIEVQFLEGEGENGGNAWILSIEDTGDPSGTHPDPGSNRKLFLARDTTDDLNLADGVTLCARFRLNPEPLDTTCTGCPDIGNGMTLHDHGKGMIGFAQQSGSTICMAIDDNQQLQLVRGDNDTVPSATPVPLDSATEWITVWLTAQSSGAGAVTVSLYMNGELDPIPPYEETLFTGVENGYESAPGSSYLVIAAGSTGRDAAWQLDYLCAASGIFEPEEEITSCPANLVCAIDNDDVQLSWDNLDANVTSFTISCNGEDLVTDLAGDSTSFLDENKAPGLYTYTVTPNMGGSPCDAMECSVNLCITNLVCTFLGPNVGLSWTNRAPFSSIVISRDGTDIATIGGTETRYIDAGADTGEHEYSVSLLDGTCEALSCSMTTQVPVPAETADYQEPQEGWGYFYDPEPGDLPEDMLLYNPVSGGFGCLDGDWSRHGESDAWDGTAPGEVDTVTDADMNGELDGAAPGGISLDTITGGGPGGGDAAVLSFEDVGDPRDITWDGVPLAWSDAVVDTIPDSGSNRKLYLGYNLNELCEDPFLPEPLLDTGVTMNVRLRLTPPEWVVDFEQAGQTAPDGLSPQGNGKGLISLYWMDATLTTIYKLSVYLWNDDEGIFWLQVGAGADADVLSVFLGDTEEQGTKFVNLWITVERIEPFDPMLHNVSLYLNGSTELFLSKEIALSEGDDEDESGTGNVITMGTMSTDEVCAFQVDFIRVASGIHEPEASSGVPVFVGDANCDDGVNIADAVSVLSYLFSGAEACCLTNMDTNNDGGVNIADAVSVLSYLFAGGNLIAPGGGGVISDPGCILYDAADIAAEVSDCQNPCSAK